MGETQSHPNLVRVEPDNNRPTSMKELIQQISEDIAGGNEGEMIDMQCKVQESLNPHVWWSYGQSQRTTTDSIDAAGIRHSRTISAQDDMMLKLNGVDSILDEESFQEGLKRSHSLDDDDKGHFMERNLNASKELRREIIEETEDEKIMRLVE